MQLLQAEQISLILFSLLFCIFFSERLIYLGLCVALAVVGGYELLEYAPAVFLPIEIIVSFARIFRRGFSRGGY